MKRTSVLPRLLALAVVFVVGLSYICFNTLGLSLGRQPYALTVQLSRGGGLYAGASVTYRGVEVGRVNEVVVTPTRVLVHLQVRPAIRVPADAVATVSDLSAAGEPYLDLVPRSAGPPYLHSGSVVPEDRTRTPMAIGTLLTDVSALVRSVDPADVRSVSRELATGLAGTDDDMRAIVAEGLVLLQQLRPVEPATLDLIRNGRRLLTTAAATDADLTAFSQGVRRLTVQLKRADPGIRSLLTAAPAAADESGQLLTVLRTDLHALLLDALPVTQVFADRIPALTALLQVLPSFGHRLASIVKNGQLRVFVFINNKDPVCGYVPESQLDLPTRRTGAPATDHRCTQHAPLLLQRGADNAPRPHR